MRRKRWRRLAGGLTIAAALLGITRTTPARATDAYVGYRGGRSFSLTSPDAPGYFVRIWLTRGQGVAYEAGNGHIFNTEATVAVFTGCDPVDDSSCQSTGSDVHGGRSNASHIDPDPHHLTGGGLAGGIAFYVTFSGFGNPHLGTECTADSCNNVVYYSASVVATISDPAMGLPWTTFRGAGRVYQTDSVVDFSVG